MATRRTRFEDPITAAFFAAGQSAGHPLTDDYNAARQPGLGALRMTIWQGGARAPRQRICTPHSHGRI